MKDERNYRYNVEIIVMSDESIVVVFLRPGICVYSRVIVLKWG